MQHTARPLRQLAPVYTCCRLARPPLTARRQKSHSPSLPWLRMRPQLQPQPSRPPSSAPSSSSSVPTSTSTTWPPPSSPPPRPDCSVPSHRFRRTAVDPPAMPKVSKYIENKSNVLFDMHRQLADIKRGKAYREGDTSTVRRRPGARGDVGVIRAVLAGEPGLPPLTDAPPLPPPCSAVSRSTYLYRLTDRLRPLGRRTPCRSRSTPSSPGTTAARSHRCAARSCSCPCASSRAVPVERGRRVRATLSGRRREQLSPELNPRCRCPLSRPREIMEA